MSTATTTLTTTTHVQPRRRAARGTELSLSTNEAQPSSDVETSAEATALALRKGATFHSPSSPSTSSSDPILDIKSLPSRQLTSPKALEDLIAGANDRVTKILASLTLSDVDDPVTKGAPIPVPGYLLDHAAGISGSAPLERKRSHDEFKEDVADAVGGAGSAATDIKPPTTSSVYTPLKTKPSNKPTRPAHFLSEYATAKIRTLIVEPILAEESLKEFHPIVNQVPVRIGKRHITCLRDLEKTLIFLAPTKSRSAKDYLNFCETSIQCIHTAVDHLNELDQRRPTDRPYTNNYFVDLVEQVREYARIMAVTRQKQAKGQKLDDRDVKPGEKLRLKGGVGSPAELVRERDGHTMSIDADRHMIEGDDADVDRSMGRRKKCDIGKEFQYVCRECGKVEKRPCDLYKHEKTHTRPFKCPKEDCKYHIEGWPTQKECERHYNDRHTDNAMVYKCLYEPCTYASKRESNCKQHMEKAHGYEYVRQKNKKGARTLVPVPATPGQSLMPTPASNVAFPPLASPATSAGDASSAFSPVESLASTGFGNRNGSVASLNGSVYGSYEMTPPPAPANYGNTMHNDAALEFSSYDNTFNDAALFNSNGQQAAPPYGDTPITGYDDSPASAFNQSFEANFDWNDLNYNTGDMAPFFPQYRIPTGGSQGNNAFGPAQQPTPAYSDFNYSDAQPHLSPSGAGDAMITGTEEIKREEFDDFTLYGREGSAQPGSNPALFPELDDVNLGSGSQFGSASQMHGTGFSQGMDMEFNASQYIDFHAHGEEL